MSALAGQSISLSGHARIEFGAGAVEAVAAAVDSLGKRRAFVVTDRGMLSTGIIDRVEALLAKAGLDTGRYDGVEPNPSTDTIDAGAAQARRFGDAVVVAVGGGSALDAAKGIALLATNDGTARDFDYTRTPSRAALPIIAVPTTAGTGAETNGFGVVEDRVAHCKVYIGHATVTPVLSILDPELTVGLPPAVTAASGMDALIHGLESLASKGSNPISAAYATEAITLVSGSLAAAVRDGRDLDARAEMIMGAHLAGLALTVSGLGLVHGIAHSITNHTGAAHGLALTAVLDDVMSRSLDAARAPYEKAARAMRLTGDDLAARTISHVRDLGQEVGAHRPLRSLGAAEQMVPAIAAGALADTVSNNHPRRFDITEVEQVLTDNL